MKITPAAIQKMQSALHERKNRRQCFASGLVRAVLLATFPLAIACFHASSYAGGTVTTCDENGLNAALSGGGTVTFSCDGTITLTTPKTISADTVIDGSGQIVTLTGGDSVQLFIVNSGAKLTLLNLALSNGRTTTNGGAIYNRGTLVAQNCIFSLNSAMGAAGTTGQNGGGGTPNDGNDGQDGTLGKPARGGAVCNLGNASFTRCLFQGNIAAGGNGGNGGNGQNGIYTGGNGGHGGAGGSAYGGAIYSTNTISITNCYFYANAVAGGSGGVGGLPGTPGGLLGDSGLGAQSGGGGLCLERTSTLVNSTFNRNESYGGWGGPGRSTGTTGKAGRDGAPSFGGGVYNIGTASTINCTYYTNLAYGGNGGSGGPPGGHGGDGFRGVGGGFYNSGTVGATNCTFANGRVLGGAGGSGGSPNGTAGLPGNSWGDNIANVGSVFALKNCIIAYDPGAGANAYGSFTDGSNNICSDASITFSANRGSQANTDPLMFALAANGGFTPTCAIAASSPAKNHAGGAPPRDQRDYRRPDTADIGAYEFGGLNDYPAMVGIAVSNALAFSGGPSAFIFYRTNYYTSPPSAAVNVAYQLSGGAFPQDYTATPALSSSGSVTIPAGQSNAIVIINAKDTMKRVSTLRVNLTTPTPDYQIIGQGYADIQIVDDYPVISVDAPDSFASESGSDTGTFSISRSGNLTEPVTVHLAVTGTAVPGVDYVALPTDIVLPVGVTVSNLTVTPLANGGTEPAETVVLTLKPDSSYFPALRTNAVVTIAGEGPDPRAGSPTVGRYMRGTGTNLDAYSMVIPVSGAKGTRRVDFDTTDYYSPISYHYNATNGGNQTYISNRFAFNTPIASFGSRWGSPLYLGQSYSFGLFVGDLSVAFKIMAFRRSDLGLAGTLMLTFPDITDSSDWSNFATNGFARTTNGFGLTTVLRQTPTMTWGANGGGWLLTHTASDDATNYTFLISAAGLFGDQWMVLDDTATPYYGYFYDLDFEVRPAWRSVFIDQPQFQGSPLPPDLWNKTPDELLNFGAAVTNSVSLSPSACTNIDQSPELRRHPILDQFVADLNNDPIALANYVQNEIDLTDAIAYRDDGAIETESVNEGGVDRGALGVYLEGQGSPVEQCALLIYLLRRAGYPSTYVFPPEGGLKMLDTRLSALLRLRFNGAADDKGRLYTTNRLITVNYPWVATYISNQWVHLFPWIKDTSVEEGLDIYDYLPDPYKDSQLWLRDYILGKTNLMVFAKTNDDTAGTVFQGFLNNALLQKAPGVSMDDIGMTYVNRRHLYAQWTDFPRPTWVTNTSIAVESLGSNEVTNVSPALTNIFDTVQVEVFSVANPQKDITTATMRMADLHNRKFFLTHTNLSSSQIQAILTLGPFRPDATGQGSFSAGDITMTNKQVLTMTLDGTDDNLKLRIRHRRQRALTWETALDPTRRFFDLSVRREVLVERPLRKGDVAGICLDTGRVTPAMLRVHAQELWNMEQQLSTNAAAVSSISPDIYQGSLVYLLGMNYYERVSRFDQLNRQLFKVQDLSKLAMGLAKISPRRNPNGTLYQESVDPVWPNVDMFFNEVAAVGNGSVRTDSGRDYEAAIHDYFNLFIADGSAQEHQTINLFFGQTNAVSTVKLLQLAQAKTASGGSNVVELNYYNYASAGNVVYGGKALKDHDPDLWSQVTNLLNKANTAGFAVAWMPPGPFSTASGSFSGMGALVLAWDRNAALIGNNQYGAFGEQFSSFVVAQPNLINWITRTDAEGNIRHDFSGATISQPTSAPEARTYWDIPQEAADLQSGATYLNQQQMQESQQVSANFGLNGADGVTTMTAAQDAGNAGKANFWGAMWTKVAEPVNALTGEFYVDEVDLSLPGPMPLQIRRNYGSQDLANNQLGYGWKLNYMPYLTVSPSNSVVYAAEADGSVVAFGAAGANLWAPTLALNPTLNNNSENGIGSVANSFNARLAKVTGPTNFWYLTNGDGSLRVFQEMSFPLAANLDRLRPYLTTWYDCRSNYYRFDYGTNASQADYGQVRRIRSSSGNLLRFEYDVYGRIVNAYSLDGRRVQYDYDEHSDLVKVTRPDTSEVRYEYQQATAKSTNVVDSSENSALWWKATSLTSSGFTADPQYAVDGNVDGDYFHYSVFGSYTSIQPWWEVGLAPANANIRTIKIWNITSPSSPAPPYTTTSNYYIFLAPRSMVNSNFQGLLDWPLIQKFHQTGVAGRPTVISVNQSNRYIRIQLANTNYQTLFLAEVQVYGFATNVVTNSFSSHLLVLEEKPDGRVLKNAYDSQRRVTNQWATVGPDLRLVRNATFLYTNNFSLTNVTNTLTGTTTILDYTNNPMTYFYTNGLIRRIRDPLGGEMVQSWYEANETNAPAYPRSLKTVTDKRGLLTSYFYDSKGNITNTTVQGDLRGDGDTSATAKALASYNVNNLPVKTVDPSGTTNLYFYTNTWLLARIESWPSNVIPSQAITNLYSYGNVTNALDGTVCYGVRTQEIRAVFSADAATNEWVYSSRGYPVKVTRYTGTEDLPVVITNVYNTRGELAVQTDAAGRTTRFGFDPRGQLQSREVFDTGQTVPMAWEYYYYNENGELTWSDGPRYNPEDYVWRDYDGGGRKSQEIHWRSQAKSDGSGVEAPVSTNLYATTFLQYDPFGNLVKTTDPLGNYSLKKYDPIGQLLREEFYDAGGVLLSTNGTAYNLAGDVTNRFNPLGGAEQTLYTSTGKPKFARHADGSTNGWLYYADGRLRREIQCNGAYWESTYDNANRKTTRIFYSATGTTLATNSTILDRRGNTIQKVDAGFNVFTNAYDGLDRLKVAAGPGPVQQITGYVYDNSGKVLIVTNALNEITVTRHDPLGRTIREEIFGSTGFSVRLATTTYSADHQGVTITNGSGSTAIVSKSFSDNDGHPLLSIGYPSPGNLEFTRRQYNLAGNLTHEERDSSSNGTISVWTTADYTYDGLNRLNTKTDRDSAVTSFGYDAAGNVTNRITPGGSLKWQAAYNNAGQMLKDWNVSAGGAMACSNFYDYFANSSPFAGLLQTRTDGAAITCTYSYDDFLRTLTATHNAPGYAPGPLTTTWAYDIRGLLTNLTESSSAFASRVSRAYNSYGQLTSETVFSGTNQTLFSSATQTWDPSGRRTNLFLSNPSSSNNYGFGWRADGLLLSVLTAAGTATYSYDNAGALTNRAVGNRATATTSLDGAGRPLTVTTKLNLLPQMTETLSWTADGLLGAHTLARGDFTDSRTYSYMANSRRLAVETLNLSASSRWTNSFAYDGGQPSGLGLLTASGQAATAAQWSGAADVFSRLGKETNALTHFTAYGRFNGAAATSVLLDGRPVPVELSTSSDSSWPNLWHSRFELTAGSHVLTALAAHPAGLFTANSNAYFTNVVANQAVSNAFDGAGRLTQRTWRSPSGVIQRTQSLEWDLKGRLSRVAESDATALDFDSFMFYDPLGRRLYSQSYSGATGTNSIDYILAFYDPAAEFLELGVYAGKSFAGPTTWKIYGPDLNGQYGGLNGTGGLEAVVPSAGGLIPLLNDARGNVLAQITNGVIAWNSSRPTGYGAVPGYRPPVLQNGNDVALSYAWRGRRPDISGYICLGARYYNPESGSFLSSDPMWNGCDPNYYSFCGGDPINAFDTDGRCAGAAGRGIAKGIDFTWNLAVSMFLTPSPEGSTDEQRQALAQISIDKFGSPMKNWFSAYDSTPTTTSLVEQLPGQLGGPAQDAMMAYAATRGGTYSPGPVRESQWRAPIDDPYTSWQADTRPTQPGPLMLPAPKQPLLLTEGSLESRVTTAYQDFYNAGWLQTVNDFNRGRTTIPAGLNWETVLGQRTDKAARDMLRDYLSAEGISEGPGGSVLVNRRLYDPSRSGAYRIPDVRIPSANLILDGTIGTKTPMTPQVQDFMNWGNNRVNIVSPTVLPGFKP